MGMMRKIDPVAAAVPDPVEWGDPLVEPSHVNLLARGWRGLGGAETSALGVGYGIETSADGSARVEIPLSEGVDLSLYQGWRMKMGYYQQGEKMKVENLSVERLRLGQWAAHSSP